MKKAKVYLGHFEREGMYQVMVDLLRSFDSDHFGASANDEYYLNYVRRLKYNYEKEIKQENVVQRDLEDLINEIKNEQDIKGAKRTST